MITVLGTSLMDLKSNDGTLMTLIEDTAANLAAFIACCCQCPCGDSPPEICETLLVTITNKTGAADCIPDSFELVWNGADWRHEMDRPEQDCFRLVHLSWEFDCVNSQYRLRFSCDIDDHYGTLVSTLCDPFTVVFDFVNTDNNSCLSILDVGPPPVTDYNFSFRATITCA